MCTVRLARRILRHLPRRNLDAVCAYYGIAIEGSVGIDMRRVKLSRSQLMDSRWSDVRIEDSELAGTMLDVARLRRVAR